MEPITEKKSTPIRVCDSWTPPESSMKKEKTRPKIRACLGTSNGRSSMEWYTLDITDDDDREIVRCRCNCGCKCCATRMRHDTRDCPLLLPRATLINDEEGKYHGSWAVSGDQLYFVGVKVSRSSNFEPPTVLAFNLIDDDNNNGIVGSPRIGVNEQWIHKPGMLIPRDELSKTVALGGKLYVLGTGYDDHDHPWAEVYDPTSNSWDALPDPPFIPESCTCTLVAALEGDDDVDDDDKKDSGGSLIILSFEDGALMEYNVVSKSWKNMYKFELNARWVLLNLKSDGRAVAVGRVLYWFCGDGINCLYGLDLDTHVVYKSKPVADIDSHEPMLGHLGGNRFFLLYEYWQSTDDLWFQHAPPLPDGTQETKFFHCWKFNVSLGGSSTSTAREGEQTMTISQESSQSFVIKDGSFFTGCVLY
ncbi:hypothetical protein Tsubulata_049539 [Turnera subulata]|uniref:Galactose oxidase/kelch repeat superfamily protein n=1 Tax=Turnera subulata TaxID=218843 RepID=A0A9Q0JQN7_9ROSI|nr:hypothetical protein Tsubulata_049539 [Turnera subulata]